MTDIAETLEERKAKYGTFEDCAKITQNLKRAMHQSRNWCSLADYQMEALEMIVHKIGRILNGDPNYRDSWHDIEGYARLVADRLEKEKQPPALPCGKPFGNDGLIGDPKD